MIFEGLSDGIRVESTETTHIETPWRIGRITKLPQVYTGGRQAAQVHVRGMPAHRSFRDALHRESHEPGAEAAGRINLREGFTGTDAASLLLTSVFVQLVSNGCCLRTLGALRAAENDVGTERPGSD